MIVRVPVHCERGVQSLANLILVNRLVEARRRQRQ
jgi:hypothetical protein